MLFALGSSAGIASAAEPAKTVGPNKCAECHKDEAEAWKASHHFSTFRQLPRNKNARVIAKKMGVKRINKDGLCLNCHFTVESKGNKVKPVAGISCESCHGSGKGWVDLHSSFSGKTEDAESDAEEAARWQKAAQAGMIQTRNVYELAKNCYSCHVVPQEDLVNKGGHVAGSKFELVSWSQGEVRHNTWYNKGASNAPANEGRKRMMYVVGRAVDLEIAVRAIGVATARQPYAFIMAKRADIARNDLAKVAQALPNVPEVAKIVQYSRSAGLKLQNERALTDAADGISQQIAQMTQKYDGSNMAAIDSLIPGAAQYKGKAK